MLPLRFPDSVKGCHRAFLVAFSFSVAQTFVLQCAAADVDHRGLRAPVHRRPLLNARSNVYYVLDTADRLASFAAKQKAAVDRTQLSQLSHLEGAIEHAVDAKDKSLLESVAVTNEESRLEAQSALDEMLTFVTTLKHSMGAEGSAASCKYLACGEHAFCQPFASASRCQCEEGYEGNGHVCNPPSRFIEHPLFPISAGLPRLQVADIHVTTVRGNGIAVAFRDVSRSHQGYVMLGKAMPSSIEWSLPMLFSDSLQAFDPVVVELEDGRGLAIAFRDRSRGGTGVLLGAAFGQSGQVTFTQPRAFARRQAQGMALLPLPGSRVALFYAEHTIRGVGKELDMYGSVLVATVRLDGQPPIVAGKHRFVSGPVARLSATVLAPSSFAVAYRRGEVGAGGPRGEASCSFVQMRGELVFSSAPLSIEPERAQIWARSVAAITNGTLAYTYHSGGEQLTKQAVLQVDPLTRQLKVLQEPTVIGRGFTPYTGTVSSSTLQAAQQTPQQLALLEEEGPRVFTYFADGSTTQAQARLCKAGRLGELLACRDLAWSRHEIVSASGAPVGDGRLAFVFSDAKGAPHYQLVGLMEPS